METQPAITLELRLGKELIQGCLMRKIRLTVMVLLHVLGFVAREAGLEVQNPSPNEVVCGRSAIFRNGLTLLFILHGLRIRNRPHDTMRAFRYFLCSDLLDINVDLDPEI